MSRKIAAKFLSPKRVALFLFSLYFLEKKFPTNTLIMKKILCPKGGILWKKS
jgi:hypothetical protein